MSEEFHKSKRSFFLGYFTVNIVPLAINIIFYLRMGSWEVFLSNMLLAVGCVVHYFIRSKKSKTVLSIGKDIIYIDDGFSVPRIGEIRRSSIRDVIFSKDGLVRIVLDDGKHKMFNAQVLSKKDQLRVQSLLTCGSTGRDDRRNR